MRTEGVRAGWIGAKLLLLSLVAGTFVTAFRAASPYDEAVYRGISRNILRSGLPIRDTAPRSLFTNSPPVGLYLDAALSYVTHDDLLMTRVLSAALLGTILVILVTRLGRRAGGPGAGAAAAGLLALFPLLQGEIVFVELDLPLTVLSAAGILAWLRYVESGDGRRSLERAAFAGALFAAAGLTKYAGFLFVPLVAADILLSPRAVVTPPWRRCLEVTAFGLPSLALLAAWQVICAGQGGSLGGTVGQLLRRLSGAEPALGAVPIGLGEHLKSTMFGLNPFLLAAAGLAVLFARGARRRLFAAAALILVVTAASSGGARQLRYQDPAIPAIAALAGAALAGAFASGRMTALALAGGVAGALWMRGGGRFLYGVFGVPEVVTVVATLGLFVAAAGAAFFAGGRPRVTARAVWLAGAVAVGLGLSPALRAKDTRGVGYGREAGHVAAMYVAPEAVVGATSPAVAYHADRPTQLLRGRSAGAVRVLRVDPPAAVILDAGFLSSGEAGPEFAGVLKELYVPYWRTEDGVELWLRRGK